MTDLGFIHRFIPATRPGLPPLLLLHGTGGDENDLVPLGERLSPGRGAAVAARQSYGKRHAAVFPPAGGRRVRSGRPENCAPRSSPISSPRARKAYALEAPVAVGFSNGANIAASLLLARPDALRGAVLLRAMLPFEPQSPPDLAGKPVLLLSGAATR